MTLFLEHVPTHAQLVFYTHTHTHTHTRRIKRLYNYRTIENELHLLLIVNISLLYLHLSKANKTEEPSKGEKPVIENLSEFYINSAIYGETKAELDQLPGAQEKKGTSAFKEPVYVTSFCHQLRWIARRSFKNLLGNPQASVAQVI
jgi:hypothetical protein